MAEPMKKAAENVWKMLDQMAEKSPEEYKTFVDQQLKEGAEMFTPPQPAFCLCCCLKKVKLSIITSSPSPPKRITVAYSE